MEEMRVEEEMKSHAKSAGEGGEGEKRSEEEGSMDGSTEQRINDRGPTY